MIDASHVVYRISMAKWIFMVLVALAFDLARLASKIFILIGLAVVGVAIGAYVGDLVGSTTIGAFVGGIIGAIATATGIGTGAAVAVGFVMNVVFSWTFALLGYATLQLWFWMEGVTVLSGERAAEKMWMSFITWLLMYIPFLDVLPGLTMWTLRMGYISRVEDVILARRAARYTRGNASRMQTRLRTPRRRHDATSHATADDFQEEAYA